MTPRAPITVVTTCLLVLGVYAVGWGWGYAHATLVSSVPAAGGRLAASPSQARLVFSEPVETRYAQLALVTVDGRRTALRPEADPHDVHAVVAPLDRLPPGAYRLVWRIVSADGHPIGGSFTFAIGDGDPDAAAPATIAGTHDPDADAGAWGPMIAGAPLIPALLRGLALGVLMAAAGLLAFFGWAPAAMADGRVRRVAVGLAIAAPVLLAAHFMAWVYHASAEHTVSADTISVALGTGVGRVEAWRFGLAVVAVWAVWLARRVRLAVPFALAALLVTGATGHAAAIRPLWAIPAKALHVLGGAAWLGGLLWLVLADRREPAAFAREAGRVSAAALAAVVVVTISGLAQAVLFLPSVADLVRSAYGAIALAKVAGVLALVAFGAHHRYRLLPRLVGDGATAGTLVVSVRREVMVMTLVVLLGGLLAYTPPPAAHSMHSTSSQESSP